MRRGGRGVVGGVTFLCGGDKSGGGEKQKVGARGWTSAKV